jgi:glucokinase
MGIPAVVTTMPTRLPGKMIYGAAKGMKNFIEITLGNGVGSGIHH